MQDYEDELRRYQREAEEVYDDYYDEFDEGFDGMEDSFYDDDYEEEYVDVPHEIDAELYDSYKASSIGRIDPNDRTYTVVVTNTSGADASVVLFGANEEAPAPAGVTITIEESSHKEVREESKANPFLIAGMKMSVSDPLQFDNVLSIVRRTAAGSNTTRVYQPRNATSPQNFTQTLIDDNNFQMEVTGQDSLRFVIKDGVTVVFTMTVKARANMGNLLRGNNVAELSRTPRTTGLPQIDLLRQKKGKVFGLPMGSKKFRRPAPSRMRRRVRRVRR